MLHKFGETGLIVPTDFGGASLRCMDDQDGCKECRGRHGVAPNWQRICVPTQTLVFSVVLAGYAVTLCKSVGGGDSGELVAAACSLGVPHPPGYPLHTLLCHAFITAIPYGTPAARCNLLSAVCSSCAACFVFSTVLCLSVALLRGPAAHGNPHGRCLACGRLLDEISHAAASFSAASAAFVFAFSDLVWRYSTHAEVFSLNNLFVSMLAYLTALHTTGRGTPFTPYAGAFVMGLGMTNQHTLALAAAPMAITVLVVSARGGHSLLSAGPLLTLAGCFIWGLFPYAYLPWAAERSPNGAWGDCSTMAGLVTHVARREYGTWRLYSGEGRGSAGMHALVKGLEMYLAHVPGSTCGIGAILSPIGSWLLLSRSHMRAAGCGLLGGLITYLVVFHALANLPLDGVASSAGSNAAVFREVHSRFWLQADLLLIIPAGVSLSLVFSRLPSAIRPLLLSLVAMCQVANSAFATPLSSSVGVLSQGFAVRDSGLDTLRACPPGALLLVKGDLHTNAVRYLQMCEGVRPDVTHIDLSHASYKWYNPARARSVGHGGDGLVAPGERLTRHMSGGYRLAQLLRANFDHQRADQGGRRAIVIKGGNFTSEVTQSYRVVPSGLAYRVWSKGEAGGRGSAWARDCAARLPLLKPSRVEAGRGHGGDGSWDGVSARDAITAYVQFGMHMVATAVDWGEGEDEVGHCDVTFTQDAVPHGQARKCSGGGEEFGRCDVDSMEACRPAIVGSGGRKSALRCAAQVLGCVSRRSDAPWEAFRGLGAAYQGLEGEEISGSRLAALEGYIRRAACGSDRPSGVDLAEMCGVLQALRLAQRDIACADWVCEAVE